MTQKGISEMPDLHRHMTRFGTLEEMWVEKISVSWR